MTNLEISVSALIDTFGEALRSIAPVVQKIGMNWKEPDVYDDWDAIAEVLYQQIVVESLRWSLPGELQSSFALPQYAMTQDSFTDTSYISVQEPKSDRPLVFHSLITRDDPFDTVRSQPIDGDGKVLGATFVDLPLKSVHFVLCLREPHRVRQVRDVAVLL